MYHHDLDGTEELDRRAKQVDAYVTRRAVSRHVQPTCAFNAFQCSAFNLLWLMSGLNLTAISDNAQRLGQRLQESFSEHTRDLAITRGSGSVYLETSDEKVKNIAKQLDSSVDREKLDAMKRLVAVSDVSGVKVATLNVVN
jgi:hypothetical protein